LGSIERTSYKSGGNNGVRNEKREKIGGRPRVSKNVKKGQGNLQKKKNSGQQKAENKHSTAKELTTQEKKKPSTPGRRRGGGKNKRTRARKNGWKATTWNIKKNATRVPIRQDHPGKKKKRRRGPKKTLTVKDRKAQPKSFLRKIQEKKTTNVTLLQKKKERCSVKGKHQTVDRGTS